jgi:hypothetical protein
MRRLRLDLVLGLVAVVLLAGGGPTTAGEKSSSGGAKKPGGHMKVFEDCAKACATCAGECEHCMTHCVKLVAEGKKDHVKTLRTCADCAEVCVAAGRIVARHGPFAHLICEPCAKACAECGKACEAFRDDPVMARCARACRDCERACREMLKHHHPSGAKGGS